MNTCVAAGVIVAICTSTLQARATLTGTWEGETRSGTPLVLTLQEKGSALTGTLVRSGESVTISDGKVSKHTFTFKATVNGQTEGFPGELTGDELKIWLDRQGASRAIVLRRVERT